MINLLERLRLWVWKQIWWRSNYRKKRTKYRGEEKCYLCHARLIPGSRYPGKKVCNIGNHPCPCKDNERLIFK